MILDLLVASSRRRVQRMKADGTMDRLRRETDGFCTDRGEAFRRGLAAPGLSFLCELKRASPSKGVIAEEFPCLDIARAYEAGGAAALSCLTEPEYFLGSMEYLRAVAAAVPLPVLRKDFITHECQIDEAALAGAAAVLLIAAILTDEELAAFQSRARELGLAALVEVHDEEELSRALQTGADCIGINHRNLKDFSIDLSLTERLRPLLPDGVLCVAESGMTDIESVRRVRDAGADAVLIGEMLMRAEDRTGLLRDMKNEVG